MRKQFFAAVLGLSTLCVSHNVNAQWTLVGSASFAATGSTGQHLFFDSVSTPYVSFANSNGQVMKYNGTAWVYVGGANITTGGAGENWSAMAPNGNIYFSYADANNSNKAGVMKYDGTSWSSIGSSLSTASAGNTNIVVSSAGTPFLSFIEKGTTPTTLHVKQYSSSTWSDVGSAVTTLGADWSSMVFGKNDTIFIAYQDANSSQNITVKKYDGTNWTQVGSSFCAQPFAGAFFISMAMDTSGKPWVAYMNPFSGGPKICVSKFDGTNWVTVGTASFTTSGSIFTAFAIDKNNVPYVSFQDGTSTKAYVMSYDGTAWVDVGTGTVSTGNAVFTSIATDANNNPYVAYMETGGTTVMKYPVCTAPSNAIISASDTSICKGDTVTLTATGILNDAKTWYWYTGSCSGSQVDTGTSIKIAPNDTTTYYVRGNGGCITYSICTNFTVQVDSVVKPTITASGLTLTSSAATGNQWYKSDTLLTGATNSTYTVTTKGWYKVKVTNSNGCSALSDSMLIEPVGIDINGMSSGVKIYPSPFTGALSINFAEAAINWQDASITIMDNIGRVVYQQKELKQQNTFQLSHIPNGMYILNIITPENKLTVKVMKQ